MIKKRHFSGSFYDRSGRFSSVLRCQCGQKYDDKKVRNSRDHLRNVKGLSGETNWWRLGAKPTPAFNFLGIMRAMVGV
jgi:hypothetical protein